MLQRETKQERRGGIETDIKISPHRISIGKQERRGGIETSLNLLRSGAGSRKQERRGGIETRFQWPGIVPRIAGSRNAVVALKRLIFGPKRREISAKQERRGGIETAEALDFLPKPLLEAGTPWWH